MTVSKKGVRVSRTIGKRGGPSATFGTNCLLQLLCLLLLVVPVRASEGAVLSRAADEPADDVIARMQPVEYVRAVDGDTIVVTLDGEETRVRLFAVDAPELEDGTVAAFRSALYLADLLESCRQLWIETDEEAQLLDPWGRTLAWVWFRPANVSQGRVLVQSRLLNEGLCTYYPKVQSKRYPWLADLGPGSMFTTEAKEQEAEHGWSIPEEPRPQPRAGGQRASGELEVGDHGLKWLKSEYGYADFSWRVEVVNGTGRKMFVNLRIELMDDDGFVLDTSYMWRKLAEPGRRSFSDTGSIEVELAEKVAGYQVWIEESPY